MNNTNRCVILAGVALSAVAATAPASTIAYTVIAENVFSVPTGSLAGATTAAVTFFIDSAAVDSDANAAVGNFATTGDINVFINGAAFTSGVGGAGTLELTDAATNDAITFNHAGDGVTSVAVNGALPTTAAFSGSLPTALPVMDFSDNFLTFFTTLDISLTDGALSLFKVTDVFIGEFVPDSTIVPIPAPAALGLFGLACVAGRRRR